jgi:predicted peptidase
MRLLVMSLLVGSCIASISQLAYPANVVDFAEYNFLDGGSNVALPGRLHIPAGYASDPGADRPLIIFLHGSGASGTDNELQLNFNIDNLLAAAKQRDAFLYAPQTNVGWEDATILSQAMSMVDRAISEKGVDPKRIYLTGLSMGGGGAWNFLNQFPDRIAATVPICGVSPASGLDVEKLIDEPIWAFHGRRDTTVPVTVTRDVIGGFLAEAGLSAPSYPAPLTQGPQVQFDFPPLNLHYTDMSGAHGITPTVYSPTTNSQLYDWMFAQSQVPEPSAISLAAIVTGVSLVGRRISRGSFSRHRPQG